MTMTVKCAIFENTSTQDKPTYKEIDDYLGKGSKVIYGGGKRKSKNTPYIDKLYLVENAFNTFERILFKNHSYTRELYLFESEANSSALTLKFADNLTTLFVIDEDLIDELSHLSWSHGHLSRFIRELESIESTFALYKDKGVSDEKYYKSFTPYLKANNKLIEATKDAVKRVENNAEMIFKFGW